MLNATYKLTEAITPTTVRKLRVFLRPRLRIAILIKRLSFQSRTAMIPIISGMIITTKLAPKIPNCIIIHSCVKLLSNIFDHLIPVSSSNA